MIYQLLPMHCTYYQCFANIFPMVKCYKKKLQDANGTFSKIEGCFYDVRISWGIFIHSSCSSLYFLVFYIESRKFHPLFITIFIEGELNMFERQKFRDENVTFSNTCVCFCVYVSLYVPMHVK